MTHRTTPTATRGDKTATNKAGVRLSHRTLLALVGVAVALLPLPARPNPVDAFGLGARSTGLAGAAAALADDFSANAYNPAALATLRDLRLAVGYLHVAPTLTLNGHDLDVDRPSALQVGLVLPGVLLGHAVAASLALHLPDARLTRVRALPERQPRFALYDNRPQRIVLTTSAAFALVPDLLHLGASLTYLSDTRGVVDLRGLVDLRDATGTTLTSAVAVDFEAVRTFGAGLLLTPGDHLRVGLAYRAPFALALDLALAVHGDIVLDGASAAPTTLVEDASLLITSANTNLFSPRQLTLALAWVTRRLAVAVDLSWQAWSAYESPTSALTLALDVGPLPLTLPASAAPTPPHFHDIVVLRLGGEVHLVDGPHLGLTLRAGYAFEPSPAPPQPGATTFVDTDKHTFALGLGLRLSDLTDVLPKPLRLDVAAFWIALSERQTLKTSAADPVGDYVAGGHVFGFASTLQLLF